jgi:hypothetical protein
MADGLVAGRLVAQPMSLLPVRDARARCACSIASLAPAAPNAS